MTNDMVLNPRGFTSINRDEMQSINGGGIGIAIAAVVVIAAVLFFSNPKPAY